MIFFIHIGKTGGSTVDALLDGKIDSYKQYHNRREYKNIRKHNKHNKKYIVWIRNPIARFVSAFNHSYYGVHTDPKTIESFDLDHSIFPTRMKDSMNHPYVFSREYDALMKSFQNANELAESLSSENTELQDRARALMNRPEEHLYHGIGWYLYNGYFVENNNDRIFFVGRTENMTADLSALSKKLNVYLDTSLRVRENKYVDKSMKYLSPLAIKNITDFYKGTDYAALKKLCQYGWITQEVLDSYYIYENK